jgi:hypothetical protein
MALDRDEMAEAVRGVVQIVSTRVAAWRFEGEPLINQAMAAAGLLRSAELLGEAVELSHLRPSVGANVLTRSAFEFWLIGNYALYGGVDAVVGIDGQRQRHETLLAKMNYLSQDVVDYLKVQQDVLDEAKIELLAGVNPSSMSLEQIAIRLGPLILEATGEQADLLAVYNLIYRTHSTYDAHPPKVIATMLDMEGDAVRVLPVPSWNDPLTSALVMTTYLCVLGRTIEQQLGGDLEVWVDVVERLTVLLTRSDNGEIPGAPTEACTD